MSPDGLGASAVRLGSPPSSQSCSVMESCGHPSPSPSSSVAKPACPKTAATPPPPALQQKIIQLLPPSARRAATCITLQRPPGRGDGFSLNIYPLALKQGVSWGEGDPHRSRRLDLQRAKPIAHVCSLRGAWRALQWGFARSCKGRDANSPCCRRKCLHDLSW